MIKLSCKARNWHWGKPGLDSLVGQAYIKQHSELGPEERSEADGDLYAELWIGDHATAPAEFLVDRNDANLLKTIANQEFLEEHHGKYISIGKLFNLSPSRFLGKAHLETFAPVSERYETQMAFLLKFLAVGKAISIQAHPNQSLSEKLHAARPDVYKDETHKPEIGVALSDDVASCFGFLNSEGLRKNLQDSKTLAELFEYEGDAT
jgi:mannose-6-phosphate isomerase